MRSSLRRFQDLYPKTGGELEELDRHVRRIEHDKRAAELGRRRTPERDLLTLAFIGGTAGALVAQQMLRHKTRKEPFRSTLWTLAALHLVLVAIAAYRLI